MNKLFLCLLFAVLTFNASSQRVYFVYLQSEQEQPFFVKLNEKIYSSSSSGYLILSKLRDSVYNLGVGFPQNKWPEQQFSVTIGARDHGYLLKNFGEKGWGLFHLQTQAVQMGALEPVARKISPKPETGEVSAFTDILSRAADDSTLKEKPVITKVEDKKPAEKPVVTDTVIAIKEEPKAEVKEPTAPPQTDVITSAQVKTDTIKGEIKEQPPIKPADLQPVAKETAIADTNVTKAVVETPYKKSVVIRRSESSTTEGFGLTFIDEYTDGARDTIRILIPNQNPVAGKTIEPVKEEKKFLDITTETVTVPKPPQSEVKKEEPKAEAKPPATDTATLTKPVLITTTNCKEVAVEADFLQLRKNMAAGENDDDMLDAARKYFRTKCFTTAQVKNLGVLFLTDEGRYKFFDLAYNYVSDVSAFSSLQSELKDEYYINRFKAMLRN